MKQEPFDPSVSSADYPLDERRGPFMEMLGVHVVSAGGGEARVEVVVGPKHLRAMAMMHGGMTATLLDTAMGMAAHSLAAEGHYSVTIQLDVKYTKPALPGEKLTATGEVQHAGKRTAVTRGEIRSASGALIATGTATMMYVPVAR